MWTISELTAQSGVSRRNVYFYIHQGILPPAGGSGLGAYYGPEHLLRLQTLPILRARGMRLDAIRKFLGELSPEQLEAFLHAHGGGESASTPASASPPTPSPAAQPQALVRVLLAPGVEVLIEAGVMRRHPQLARRLMGVVGETLAGADT
jgi:DNA-binding transcriptional MerR regulator